MGETKIWAAMALLLALFFGAAGWLAHGHLPSMSAALPSSYVPAGRAVALNKETRFVLGEDGRVWRFGPGEAEREMVFQASGGLARLAVAGDRVFLAHENDAGQALLHQLEPPVAFPFLLEAAASALAEGPDGALWIGGVDGSIWRKGETGFSRQAEELPSWVRFLRYDSAAERMLAISADGSRLDLSGAELTPVMTIASAPNPFTLHAALSVETAPDPYPPGREFQDCERCPVMMVIPGGTFLMGSSEGVGDNDERPQHEVTIAKVAIAKYETTFDEWEACVADGFCRAIENDLGWGRGRRPVINVSWQDITGQGVEERGFLAWMNAKVEGDPYRLPSEAEWEYAARAGTVTAYAFGEEISPEQANFGLNFEGGRTSPVGAYLANAFGLHDMHGNVWEWAQDCWHGSYEEAPADSSAWMEEGSGDCSRAVLRGGSWVNEARNLRSANRNWDRRVNRSYVIGFRLARTLPDD